VPANKRRQSTAEKAKTNQSKKSPPDYKLENTAKWKLVVSFRSDRLITCQSGKNRSWRQRV